MNKISKEMLEHYTSTFNKYGPTPKGVDWSNDESKVILRFNKITGVIHEYSEEVTLLDVGCGYGSLFSYLKQNNKYCDFQGIDLSDPMISYAKKNYSNAKWIVGDFLEFEPSQNFDYILSNGILTQKLFSSNEEMFTYSRILIEKMFRLCNIGISFNVMSKDANFYVDNLFYQDPSEILKWCRSNLSKNVTLDQSYKLHEFTMYVYK